MQTKPESRAARLMLATLAGPLALGGTLATIARAETGSGDAATVQALGSATISLADAIRTAEAAGQGMVVGAEFEIKDGKPVFDVTTRNGTTEVDHLIDPATGAILASTPDAEEADGDDDAEEASEVTGLQGAQVSLMQAIATAEAQGGKALSAEYGQEDGRPAVELELVDASGRTVEITIDAMTGTVAAADAGSGDEDGDGEGHEDGESGEEQEG